MCNAAAMDRKTNEARIEWNDRPIVRVEATVMERNELGWSPHLGVGHSKVAIYESAMCAQYKLYGYRTQDKVVTLDVLIPPRMPFNKGSAIFHHWVIGGQRLGLAFNGTADARSFDRGIRVALENLEKAVHQANLSSSNSTCSRVSDDVHSDVCCDDMQSSPPMTTAGRGGCKLHSTSSSTATSPSFDTPQDTQPSTPNPVAGHCQPHNSSWHQVVVDPSCSHQSSRSRHSSSTGHRSSKTAHSSSAVDAKVSSFDSMSAHNSSPTPAAAAATRAEDLATTTLPAVDDSKKASDAMETGDHEGAERAAQRRCHSARSYHAHPTSRRHRHGSTASTAAATSRARGARTKTPTLEKLERQRDLQPTKPNSYVQIASAHRNVIGARRFDDGLTVTAACVGSYRRRPQAALQHHPGAAHDCRYMSSHVTSRADECELAKSHLHHHHPVDPILKQTAGGGSKRRRCEELGEIVRCRNCQAMFNQARNRPGSCPDAPPDACQRCMERISCVPCADALLYHVCRDSEGDYPGSAASCLCARRYVDDDGSSLRRRWLLWCLVSLVLPCLWFYPLLRGCYQCGVACHCCGSRHQPTPQHDNSKHRQAASKR